MSVAPVDSEICDAQSRQKVNRIPRATYRFQLRSGFGFDQISSLIPYVESLGISDLYLSPLFQSREDSVHGYDVVDHTRIEPSFGDEEAFRRLATTARNHGLGILLDLVPNHMGINDSKNLHWNDVLENGQTARSAGYFDIDWSPANGGVDRQILLPFLGKPFGETLESGELSIIYENERFSLAYFDRKFPLSPSSWPVILEAVFDKLPEDVLSSDPIELRSIITQLRNLPTNAQSDETSTEERYREQDVARRRLASLFQDSPIVKDAIPLALEHLNGGRSGGASRWDALEDVISKQHYRLAFWRVAADEINYRRFFDINDLAAIRVENDDVFRAVHELTFRLLSEGLVTGVRIDHPDGLLDPKEYFRNLQASYRRIEPSSTESCRRLTEQSTSELPLYIVVEKILSGDERLRDDWPVSGTTGYEFLNDLSGLLVNEGGVRRLQDNYETLTETGEKPRDIVYQGKLTILQDSMSSELAMVASRLFKLAKANRATRDFTMPALHRALREVVASFPVYRTYVPPYGWEVTDEDHRRVMDAIRWAKRRNRTMTWSMLDYIASVLLLEFPSNLAEHLKPQWRNFATRFQQVTGPVTAKGVEDTSFYRYFPLASLNEVGGELGTTGISPGTFHRKMQARAKDWPNALSTTATHDTKRGEDVRARLNALSEIPDRWADQVLHLHKATNHLLQEIDGEAVPSKNERYLFYQTLVGTWPVDERNSQTWKTYQDRIMAYCRKALREAKQHTSWLNPSEPYEAAVDAFLEGMLKTPDAAPLKDISLLAEEIAGPGFVNSIAQLVLKSTLPGVPDFYQGSEFWDFRLVDPDNRKPVDFEHRTQIFDHITQSFKRDGARCLDDLQTRWGNDLKMWVMWRALHARRAYPDAFEQGDYQAITFEGPLADFLFGFVRQFGTQWICVVVPRMPKGLAESTGLDQIKTMQPRSFCGNVWKSTNVVLPAAAPVRWADLLLGREHETRSSRLAMDAVFASHFTSILVGNTLEGTTP